MLNELMKILGAKEHDQKIMYLFSLTGLNSLEIEIDGTYFHIEEPLPLSNRILVKIRNLSKEGLGVIDMITDAALKSREHLIRSGVLYIYFLLNFEEVRGVAMALIRSYGFLDTRYCEKILKSLDHAGVDYAVYDLVRIVDLGTRSLVNIDTIKREPST